MLPALRAQRIVGHQAGIGKVSVIMRTMIRPLKSSHALITTFAIMLSACTGPLPTPSTPPTFVMAWTDTGEQVHTIESPDGLTWRNATAHARANSTGTPEVAHDGRLTWLLIWGRPIGLHYKVGIGGAPISEPEGIIWEQNVTSGQLPVSINGGPAAAFGNGRWVVVYRSSGGGLEVVRSQPNDPTEWEAPTNLLHRDPGGDRPVGSTHDPDLAFGNGRFVLGPVSPCFGFHIRVRSGRRRTWTF